MTQNMAESDFWTHLEFRLSREFAGLPDNHLRFLSCDGFIPEEYLLDHPSPRIIGRAWIGNGASQEQWSSSLFLSRPYCSRSEIDRQTILPHRADLLCTRAIVPSRNLGSPR
jgi:hypothetical protein